MSEKKYRPSNGSEGMWFMGQYCDRCKHDTYTDEEPEQGCSIMGDSMCYDVEEEDYPSEWIYNEKDHPVCTKFESTQEPTP